MRKETIKNFFDEEYEYQIINCIVGTVKTHESVNNNGEKVSKKLRDTRYGESIIGLLDEAYFSTSFLKTIVGLIKKYYSKK